MRIYKYKCDFCGKEFECDEKKSSTHIAAPTGNITIPSSTPHFWDLMWVTYEICDDCLSAYIQLLANFVASVNKLRERESKPKEV